MSLFDITNLEAGEIALAVDETGRILPVDGESVERVIKMKRGEPYIFTMKRARNYPFLKKYFSLLNTAFQNQDKFTEPEWFRKHTLLAVGWCTEHIDPFTGDVCYVAKSVSFSKCSEMQFMEIYGKTVDFLVSKYGFDDKFVNEVMGYL